MKKSIILAALLAMFCFAGQAMANDCLNLSDNSKVECLIKIIEGEKEVEKESALHALFKLAHLQDKKLSENKKSKIAYDAKWALYGLRHKLRSQPNLQAIRLNGYANLLSTSGSSQIRVDAAEALAGVAMPKYANILLKALKDSDYEVRIEAITGLFELKNPAHCNAILNLFFNDDNILVEEEASCALTGYCQKKALKQLKKRLKKTKDVHCAFDLILPICEIDKDKGAKFVKTWIDGRIKDPEFVETWIEIEYGNRFFPPGFTIDCCQVSRCPEECTLITAYVNYCL